MLRLRLLGWALLQAAALPDARPALVVDGRGVQIYVCSVDRGWVFKAPEATLYLDGKVVGTHGAGPRWTWQDGSAITGKLVSSTAAPDAGKDIAWLTLTATPVAGTSGALTAISTVKRTETRGGVAPATGCDAGRAGVSARVAYTATYSFYR